MIEWTVLFSYRENGIDTIKIQPHSFHTNIRKTYNQVRMSYQPISGTSNDSMHFPRSRHTKTRRDCGRDNQQPRLLLGTERKGGRVSTTLLIPETASSTLEGVRWQLLHAGIGPKLS